MAMASPTPSEELAALREKLGMSRDEIVFQLRTKLDVRTTAGTLARYESGKTRKIDAAVLEGVRKLAGRK